MRVLAEKNTQLSQELEKCKANFRPHWLQQGSPKRPPLVTYPSNDKYHIECGVYADLTIKLQMTLE